MLERKIIPAILTDVLDHAEKMIARIEGVADLIQIDYVDGYFAPELTCCEAKLIKEIQTPSALEIHLMVEEPIDQVEDWHKAGANRLVGHIEEMESQTEFVERVNQFGMEVGLALNLDTPLSELDDSLIKNLDVVLLMGHKVGVQHAPFVRKTLKKIQQLRSDYPYLNIEVDGGVNHATIREIAEAGANWFAVGSDIFDNENAHASYRELIGLIQ